MAYFRVLYFIIHIIHIIHRFFHKINVDSRPIYFFFVLSYSQFISEN